MMLERLAWLVEQAAASDTTHKFASASCRSPKCDTCPCVPPQAELAAAFWRAAKVGARRALHSGGP